jgi:soluble lytic murein transglycosylase-like protein
MSMRNLGLISFASLIAGLVGYIYWRNTPQGIVSTIYNSPDQQSLPVQVGEAVVNTIAKITTPITDSITNIIGIKFPNWISQRTAGLSDRINEIAGRWGVPPAFMMAIVQQESSGRATITVNTKTAQGKAVGLTQITEATGLASCGLNLQQLQDPDINLECAGEIMWNYYQKYKDWNAVAIAWFSGPGAADTYANTGVIPQTCDKYGKCTPSYVQEVMNKYNNLSTIMIA